MNLRRKIASGTVSSDVSHEVDPQTSARMRRVRQRDTEHEIEIRRRLHAEGFRFRVNVKGLPGSPDVVLPRFRTAVFVHGCFWHGHDCPRGRRPKKNKEYWSSKIEKNVARDKRNLKLLTELGWRVFVIWDCKFREELFRVLRFLEKQRKLQST